MSRKNDSAEVELAIGPTGRLRLIPSEEAGPSIPAERAVELRAALGESNAAGLVVLAKADWPESLPVSLAWWRGWVQRFFRAVCHCEGEPGAAWGTLPRPEPGELAALVAAAPPMVGLDFLSARLLEESWGELASYAADAATAAPAGPLAWLRQINPLSHLVGKVTFHLAENKRDPDFPFAFLATFAHKLSASAKPQHRPLSDAVRDSLAAADRELLERLLEPVRRAAADSPLVAELLRSKRLFAPQYWSASQAYDFIRQAPAMEAAGVVIRLPNWWAARQQHRPVVEVHLGNKQPAAVGAESILDFQAQVAMDGEPLSPDELKALLRTADGLVLLRGRWIEVDQVRLKETLDHWKKLRAEYPDGLGILDGLRMLAKAPIGTELVAERVATWSHVVPGAWLRKTLERMRAPAAESTFQPGQDLQAVLRPYQADGVRWLWFMQELGLGACLADDMGLGKTIQVLDLLLQRKRQGMADLPTLLIVPASLLGNWKQEASRFAPTLRTCFLHRSELGPEELARRTKNPKRGLAEFDLVVTSYGMVRRQPWLEKLHWPLVILDEAQAIKNANSAQTKAIKKLRAQRRLVMTGTPIENHVGELWSLFDFASPGLLGTAAEFKRFVGRLNAQRDDQAFAGLRRLVRPYILRRQKSDPAIAPDLPEKIEMRAECGLTKPQTVLYAKVVDELRELLSTTEGMQRRGLILASLMQFKQICNHPAQFLGDERYDPDRSGKFLRLKQLCEPIAARQEKVLVFTQFQTLCAPLANHLATVFGRPGLMLHGGTPVKQRSGLVGEFQNDPDVSFFVISLKAGGSGLNLTAATHVVHFDRWWNPAVENQATDRAFRIGQQRNVLVHKFVCRGTIEERIDALIESKRAVAEEILDGEGPKNLTEMANDELLRFVSLDLNRAADMADAGDDEATVSPGRASRSSSKKAASK